MPTPNAMVPTPKPTRGAWIAKTMAIAPICGGAFTVESGSLGGMPDGIPVGVALPLLKLTPAVPEKSTCWLTDICAFFVASEGWMMIAAWKDRYMGMGPQAIGNSAAIGNLSRACFGNWLPLSVPTPALKSP